MKNTSGTSSLVQENQAIKRQKLDGGLSRQVSSVNIVSLRFLNCVWFLVFHCVGD